MIARFFIDKPILSSVASILIFMSGFISIAVLPIEQYPNIVPPTISVSAVYPGASADVIASTVASPLENAINGVEGMIYMNSTSSDSGQMTLSITFKTGTDPEQALINVSNLVQAATPLLPSSVTAQGLTVKKNSSSILQVVVLSSPDGQYNPLYLSNYAALNVLDQLQRIPGVGNATIFGNTDYSMRIWIRPDQLAEHQITTNDVIAAIQEQNSQFSVGQFGQAPMSSPQAYTVTATTKGRFTSIQEFEDIILKTGINGENLKLKDVARIELGALNYNLIASYNTQPAIAVGIYLQSGANALNVAQEVKQTMEQLSKSFPNGITYSVPFDITKFVKNSIQEVIMTFAEALILVTIVIYIFLQNYKATIIPICALPVSLVGTLAGMYILGFSINLLTLFGMVLAIGIVVDDAIVVLENIERIMRTEKLQVRDAAIKAMQEVTGPIIAIVLVLCAVFIPVGFMGGLTGEMYKQFAITIAISVVISGFVALTLTPSLCVVVMKSKPHKLSPLFTAFNNLFERFTNFYLKGTRFILYHPTLGISFFLILCFASATLYFKTPKSLVPQEDQGFLISIINLLPGASIERTEKAVDDYGKLVLSNPSVQDIVSLSGLDLLSSSSSTYTGASFISLKDWSKRTKESESANALARTFMGMAAAQINDAFIMVFSPPPISGISFTGGFELYLQNRSGASINSIAEMAKNLVTAASQRKELSGVQTTIAVNVPHYYVHLDRIKAKSLGIPVNAVFQTISSTLGSYYVNDFTLFGKVYHVTLQSESRFREKPEDLQYTFVQSANGSMIPILSLVKIERMVGASIIERFNGFPAAKIMGNPAPGYSSGQAISAMTEVAAEVLPDDYSYGWVSSAYQEKVASNSGEIAFIAGIIVVFLILSALYEKWLLPFAVIATIPFAIFGAVIATWMRGLDNDVYFQVGLLTLIGLSAKNAILIVEFAMMMRKEGVPTLEAALEAARLRFRPIIMTSIAFVFGCVPLALSSGAGAASRHSIGTGVIGGMLASTFIAVFFVPLFFRIVVGISEYFQRKTSQDCC